MPTDYHVQLLALARDLIAGRTNRAKLHRAVSTAYYALFHLLVGEGARLVRVDFGSRRFVARAFDHGTMRRVCNQIRSGNLPPSMAAAYSGSVPPELKRVAEVFVSAQGLRHEADYDIGRATFTRKAVQQCIDEVADALAKWQAVSNQPVVRAFLVALLIHKERGG